MKDIIARMAIEAGDEWDDTLPSDKAFLERFAALVVAEEREACARLAEECMEGNGSVVDDVLKDIAELIRERGIGWNA
jgi:hypothetical protein